jgi:predicted RNase H-like nuclease
VRVIGVDLAWACGNPSGLCAVERGRVLASAVLIDDDAIDAWIRAWATDDVLVAFDAPLVVANTTGRRPCEAVMAAAFRGEHAGPYPANLTILRHDVRAARLAERLGLDVSPEAFARSPLRAAIEVFPHPALVVFLARSERLPYKAKPGRSFSVRYAAMHELVRGLLALREADPPLDVTTSPAWEALAASVGNEPRGRALKRLEDELDAYVCAYVGVYHLAWRGRRSLTVGDGASGYIVTPVTERHAALLRAHAGAVPVG